MNKFTAGLLRNTLSVFCLAMALTSLSYAQGSLSGDWTISSSVGGEIPISVSCTLIQTGTKLSGTCTPVMDNAEPSELTGEIQDSAAIWGYDVVFNGNPGRVDFSADVVQSDFLSGTLSLSGTTAPFEAHRP